MDHLIPPAKSKQFLELGAAPAAYPLRVAVRVGAEAPRNLGAIRPAHDHRIAAIEATADLCDAGGEEAATVTERAHRPRIDVQLADRLQAARDPLLAHRER